jgi:hypothetical protein
VQIGDGIDETGTLVRSGGGFALRRDRGGVLALDLQRVPVDHVEKPVRVRGHLVAENLVEVESIVAN